MLPSVNLNFLDEEYKYILIGGGIASYSALESILKNDPNAKILLVSNENSSPYSRPPLSKELWSKSEKELNNVEEL